MSGCQDKETTPPSMEQAAYKGVIDNSDLSFSRGARGGSFIRADIQELDTLNIVTTRSPSVYATLNLVFEGLLNLNPLTGAVREGIAASYYTTNDGYSLVFHLDKNARFSDGVPCTARDVLFSFEEIYMNPDVNSRKTEVLKIRDQMISVHRIDDYTVRIDLPVPYRPFLYTFTRLEILPSHILAPLIEKQGIEAFNNRWGSLNSDLGWIVGTGPFRIKELKKGEYLKLARNPYYGPRKAPGYLEGMPYLDEIIELLNVDSESKNLKFQIGEMDFYRVKDFDIHSGDFETLLENRKEGRYRIYYGGQTLNSSHFLCFNLNPKGVDKKKLEIFNNIIFRKAVASLIDHQALIQETYQGYASSAPSSERNVSPFYNQNLEPYSHNPEKAQNLFAQIPLKDVDEDGYRDLPSGEPFSFTITTNEKNPFRVKMGKMIKESLKQAGINARLQLVDYDVLLTRLLDTFEWEAVIVGIEGSIEPNQSSWVWESDGPLHLWHPYQERPCTEWEKKIDRLFAMGRTTWEFEKAKKFYFQYQEIIRENLPVINLAVPAELYGFRNGYGNIIPRSVTYNSIGIMPYVYQTD
ncbi:MAG: ABC transporter substrate-binding protein [Spirochaetota bacterium]